MAACSRLYYMIVLYATFNSQNTKNEREKRRQSERRSQAATSAVADRQHAEQKLD